MPFLGSQIEHDVTATFSGGTGKFVGFEAHADVTADSDGSWHWMGHIASTDSAWGQVLRFATPPAA